MAASRSTSCVGDTMIDAHSVPWSSLSMASRSKRGHRWKNHIFARFWQRRAYQESRTKAMGWRDSQRVKKGVSISIGQRCIRLADEWSFGESSSTAMLIKSPRVDFTVASCWSESVMCWYTRRSSSSTWGYVCVNVDSMRVVSYDHAGLLVRPLSASSWGFFAMTARMPRAMRNESRRSPM